MTDTPLIAKLIDIRIKIDEFEDTIVESLKEIRTEVIAQNIAHAVDLLDEVLKTLSEDTEE